MSRSLLFALLAAPSLAWGQATVSTTVLWYEGNGGNPVSESFRDHIQGIPGNVFENNGPLSSLNLDNYRFVVLGRPAQPFTEAEVQQLIAYIENDGLLVIAGESNIGGDNYIITINDLLAALGADMRLESDSFQNPDDPGNPGVVPCLLCTTPSATPLLPTTTRLSAQNVGDIATGTATTVFAAFEVNIPEQGNIETQIGAVEGRIVLTADADMFSDNACGMLAKEVFWNSLWTAVCDFDEDGVASARCGGFDCDDEDPTDGANFLWQDLDGDGFGDPGVTRPCGGPGTVDDSTDCDDSDDSINVTAAEVCDGIDNDCSGQIDDDPVDATTWFEDEDGDGFGRDDNTTVACEQPEDTSDVGGDCDDARAPVNPAAEEACQNNRDDDCDGMIDEGCPIPQPIIPTDQPEGTCGCAATGATPLWLGALGMFGLSRRRARR